MGDAVERKKWECLKMSVYRPGIAAAGSAVGNTTGVTGAPVGDDEPAGLKGVVSPTAVGGGMMGTKERFGGGTK